MLPMGTFCRRLGFLDRAHRVRLIDADTEREHLVEQRNLVVARHGAATMIVRVAACSVR
jgi:hypothetical protein